jgi:tRNA 2-thiouridine synthesizing protein E
MNQRTDTDLLAPACDNEGYLLDPTEWTREWAEAGAAADGLALTDAHWRVLDFIRAWYDDYQAVPEARRVITELADATGDKRGAKALMYQLFPHGYGQQACRYAGMRKPLKLMLDV